MIVTYHAGFLSKLCSIFYTIFWKEKWHWNLRRKWREIVYSVKGVVCEFDACWTLLNCKSWMQALLPRPLASSELNMCATLCMTLIVHDIVCDVLEIFLTCQGRSQSSGITNAPNQAPNTVRATTCWRYASMVTSVLCARLKTFHYLCWRGRGGRKFDSITGDFEDPFSSPITLPPSTPEQESKKSIHIIF